MNFKDAGYIGLGALIGMGAIFYHVDTPKADRCETYKVATKSVVSYALKPPACTPTETVVYKACPQTSEKAEPVSEPIETKADEPKRRQRRHHRVRRYWR